MLRKLIKGLAKDESSNKPTSGDLDLVTIGRIKGRHYPIQDADIQITVAADDPDVAGDDNSSKRDDDGDSMKQMITVRKTIYQTSVEQPKEN
ncbi:hypothetical protein B7463_g9861, partial [Scytalidium lignicola]